MSQGKQNEVSPALDEASDWVPVASMEALIGYWQVRATKEMNSSAVKRNILRCADELRAEIDAANRRDAEIARLTKALGECAIALDCMRGLRSRNQSHRDRARQVITDAREGR
jgi:hypothetical protein